MPQETVPNPPPGFEKLSPEEQVEYIQALWERVSASPDSVPTPDWHLEIVRERLATLESSAEPTRSWSDIRAEIEQKLEQRRTQR